MPRPGPFAGQSDVRWRCKGQVVSVEDAERIKQERVQRIQRVLQREPIVPGRRLGGTGTGFFVSTSGQVLTNNHVIDDCEAITVTPAAGDERIAKVRGADPGRDLALLETGTSTPRAAVFRGHDEFTVNEPVTVVGYPLHGKVVIKPVLVSGHILDGARSDNANLFAMKIDIRSGNSGGPVLDEAGRVVGVVFAKIDTPAVYAKTGKLVRDVGLAIRLNLVRDFLRLLSVDARGTTEGANLEQAPRLERAREFIVQVGCWK